MIGFLESQLGVLRNTCLSHNSKIFVSFSSTFGWRQCQLTRRGFSTNQSNIQGRMGQMLNSTELVKSRDASELQKRMSCDGYVYFEGLLDREKVLELRRKAVETLHEFKWLDRNQPDMTYGTLVSEAPAISLEGGPDPHDWPIFDAIQKLEIFHRLPHSRPLMEALEMLYGEPVLMHPRHIFRMHFPKQPWHRTLPHQDYPYVQGSERFVTCWVPVGDCPLPHGGLAVFAGSHRYGELPLVHSNIGSTNARMVDTSSLSDGSPSHCRWVRADYRAGDVLVFNCKTVHMSLGNESPAARLSLDCRAQPRGDPVSARALQPNWTRQTWEEIYAAWGPDAGPVHVPPAAGAAVASVTSAEEEDVRYYWRRGPPLTVIDENTFDSHAFQSTFDIMDY